MNCICICTISDIEEVMFVNCRPPAFFITLGFGRHIGRQDFCEFGGEHMRFFVLPI